MSRTLQVQNTVTESLTFSLQIHNAAASGMSDVTNLNITEYTGTQCFVSLMTLSGLKDKRSLCRPS